MRAGSKTIQFVGSQYPLAADGIQRWHVIDAALTFIYGTVGAAYRFGPLSVGVAGNVILSSVSFSQAKNLGAPVSPTRRERGGRTSKCRGSPAASAPE